MNRRSALTLAAAISLGITGVAAAVGATTYAFGTAEATTKVGHVAPVDPDPTDPVIERHVIEVTDPPVAGTSTAGPGTEAAGARPSAVDAPVGSSADEHDDAEPDEHEADEDEIELEDD